MSVGNPIAKRQLPFGLRCYVDVYGALLVYVCCSHNNASMYCCEGFAIFVCRSNNHTVKCVLFVYLVFIRVFNLFNKVIFTFQMTIENLCD